MNHTNLAMILLIAVMGTCVLMSTPAKPQSTQQNTHYQILSVDNAANKASVARTTTEIGDASYRLAHHCKMIVLESLIIIRQSINLALDVAIESL